MKRKITEFLIGATGAIAIVFFLNAVAFPAPYVKAGMGIAGKTSTIASLTEDGQDYYNTEIGYTFGSFSAGIEYQVQPGDAADLHGAMLNGYYQIPKSDIFITAGAGVVHPKNKAIEWSGKNLTAIYQAGIGASLQLYDKLRLEPTLGYYSTAQSILKGKIPVDANGLYANASLKYTF
jgi:hypothetical protein